MGLALRWRHYEHDDLSNHQPHDCLLKRLFRCRSKKTPRHWPLWGEFNEVRWIPRTKGQYSGKCFHLMTSSWGDTVYNVDRKKASILFRYHVSFLYAAVLNKWDSGGIFLLSNQINYELMWKTHHDVWIISSCFFYITTADLDWFEFLWNAHQPFTSLRIRFTSHPRRWSLTIPTFGIRARAALSCVRGKKAGGYGCNWGAQCRQAPIPRVACVLILINFYQRYQAL